MPGFELFGEQEKKEIQDVLDSGVLMRYGFEGMRNGHWKAKELEAALMHRMQSKHAHVVSSGTAALTVGMASAGIGAGDEVILPTFTFVASFEAVLALGPFQFWLISMIPLPWIQKLWRTRFLQKPK